MLDKEQVNTTAVILYKTSQDLIILYKSCIHLTLKYGCILYLEAATTHLCRLDNLQSQIEHSKLSSIAKMLQLWD